MGQEAGGSCEGKDRRPGTKLTSATLLLRFVLSRHSYSIPVFNFPYDVEEDDEETIVENAALRVRSSLRL